MISNKRSKRENPSLHSIADAIDLIARNLADLVEKNGVEFDKIHKSLRAISDDNRLLQAELRNVSGSVRGLVMLSGESDREVKELRDRIDRLKEQSGFE